MKPRLRTLTARCLVCAIAVVPASAALAGGKGKSDRAQFAQSSGGNGGGNSLKFRATMSGNSAGTGGSSILSNSLSAKGLSSKSAKSFGQLNSGGTPSQNFSSPNFNSLSGKFNKLNSQSLYSDPTLSGGSRPPRSTMPFASQKSFTDAIHAASSESIDPGIGNGTGGLNKLQWKGKLVDGDAMQLADSIKDHKFFPVGNGGNGNGNGGPGNGNGNGGPGNGNGDHCDHDTKDCHDNDKCHDHCDFPWWEIIVGGCYHGGCHDDCHDGCWNGGGCYHGGCGGCYGGCYTNVVTYPSVTNVVVQPPVDAGAAAQAALTPGIDLELLDVRLVDAGDADHNLGPRYRLTFGNRGTLAAGNFQVLLMATSDGTPQAGAPTATAEVAGLASRQVLSADVRLPLSSELATLGKFIVVVDSAAQVNEPNENNNVAVLEREKIATVDPTTVAVQ